MVVVVEMAEKMMVELLRSMEEFLVRKQEKCSVSTCVGLYIYIQCP